MKYEKHIFICNNQRDENAPRVSCGETTGNEIAARFKELIQEHKLRMRVRAQRTSCFAICEKGPIMVVYPEGVFYGGVNLEDVEDIFEQHILNNRPVERLRLHFEKR